MNYTYSPLEYKKQIDTYKELLKISFNKDDDYNYVISKLKETSLKKKEIANIANVIINEYLERFEKNPDLLTNDDASKLEEFINALTENQTNIYNDISISERIEIILKEYYKKIGDFNKYIVSLSIAQNYEYLLYANHSNWFSGSRFDEEIMSLIDKMGEMDLPILGRYLSSLAMVGQANPKGLTLVGKTLNYDLFKQKIDILRKYYDPYKDNTHLSFLMTVIGNIFGYFSGDLYYANIEGRVVDVESIRPWMTELVNLVDDFINKGNTGTTNLELMKIMSLRAKFYLGMVSLDEMLEELDNIAKEAMNITNPLYKASCITQSVYTYSIFLSHYSKLPKKEIKRIIKEKIDENLPKVLEITRMVNNYQFNFIIMLFVAAGSFLGRFEDFADLILKITVYSDKTLYIHTVMVKELSLVIFDWMIEHNIEFFNGVCKYDLEYIKNHKEELRNQLGDCCMYHDIGKFFMIDIIDNSMRRLTDDEFDLLKIHPQSFEDIYEVGMMDDEHIKCIHDCALTHHLWYDGSKGYPKVSHTYNKPLTNILSIADSIDAATDDIGRPYIKKKTIDDLMVEFKKGANTQYSEDVIKALEDESVKKRLEYLVNEGRKDIYYQVYTNNEIKFK